MKLGLILKAPCDVFLDRRSIGERIPRGPDLTTSRKVGAKFVKAPDLTASRKIGGVIPDLLRCCDEGCAVRSGGIF